ncbi:MAG: diacylglycerol kinase family protein [Bacteroidales bacterium]
MNVAIQGLAAFFRTELHAVYHSLAAIAALIAGYLFEIQPYEWGMIVFAIALVFITEITNTLTEKLLDLLHPGYHQKVRQIKDMAAGLVLFAAITAIVTGAIVFLPYIL